MLLSASKNRIIERMNLQHLSACIVFDGCIQCVAILIVVANGQLLFRVLCCFEYYLVSHERQDTRDHVWIVNMMI